jgi:hypothetical protein
MWGPYRVGRSTINDTHTGFTDSMTSDAARGLAALLNAAADAHDKRIAEKLKNT